MYGGTGSNQIYAPRDHIIHNGLFAEWEVLDNFRGLLRGPRTRTVTCKLVLKDPQGQ